MPKIGAKRIDEMLRFGTPVEDYREEFGLWVKREDLACRPPGPPFSKTRGVFARVASRREKLIGVLDTRHSQAGWAVARACQILGKECINFYPSFVRETGPHPAQEEAAALGAELYALQAGRSAILFHQAKKITEARGGYMMPNALKLDESVTETAAEVPEGLEIDRVIIPISSGTIAAGVVRGFCSQLLGDELPKFIIHMGYSRSHDQVRKYIYEKAGYEVPLTLIDEEYFYKDVSRWDGPQPPWPCNEYYDLKAFHWWMNTRLPSTWYGKTLFWNIG